MTRIGLTPDELAALPLSGTPARYVAHVDSLSILAGQILAVVGPGAAMLRGRITERLDGVLPIDGSSAARGGTLRVHAVQARRVGLTALSISDPLAGDVTGAAASLVLADLAGLADLGLTTVVEFADLEAAALVADRVVVASLSGADRAYPVLTPRPRTLVDVAGVAARTRQRIAAA